MKKICGIATKAVTIRAFMVDNLKYVAEHGYESYCISNPDDIMTDELLGPIKFVPVKMQWGNVTPFEVIKQVYRFYKIFKKEKFDVIQYATANAGLYAAIAGWLARVPVRVFLQWGVAYPDYSGIKRFFYKSMEKLTCTFSTSVQPDSKANLDFAIAEGLFKKSKGCVLYNGSACGINLERFNIGHREEWKAEVFDKYQLHQYKRIFGFVGRVVPEKGINELLEAFIKLSDDETCLLLVGDCSEVERLDKSLYEESLRHKNIIYTGPTNCPQKAFVAMDFLVLPSYREGFGMVVLEAGAMGTPSIISNINGPTEFVRDGYNGIICEVKSTSSLLKAIEKALNLEDDEYKLLCQNSYKTAKNNFDSQTFKELFLANRNQLINNCNS